MARLILICISLFCDLSYGAIGKITEHEKDPASIVRNNDKLEGKKGTELEMNDTIHTGKSVVGITFDDETKVNITENSKLLIDDFVYEPKKGAGKLGMKVAMGTVRYTSGIIAHKNPNAVDIKTPTATIAVRGTDFLMSVDEIGRSLIILLPQCDAMGVCITGIIDVETPAGIVTLNQPNQATMVGTGFDPPSPPVVLNMEGRQLNSSLQVSQPKTSTGGSMPAKEDTKKDSSSSSSSDTQQSQQAQVAVVAQQDSQQLELKKEPELIQQILNVQKEIVVNEDLEHSTSKSEKVFAVFEKSTQTNWMYKSTNTNNKGYINLMVPKVSDVFLTINQDSGSDIYTFGKGTGGVIIINQITK